MNTVILPDRPIVLIPAHNEAATVGAIVAQIRALWGCPVVVIDDCSTDRTAQVARTAGAVVLPLTLQLGAWGAIQTGLRYALRHRYQHRHHPRRRRSARTGQHRRPASTAGDRPG